MLQLKLVNAGNVTAKIRKCWESTSKIWKYWELTDWRYITTISCMHYQLY